MARHALLTAMAAVVVVVSEEGGGGGGGGGVGARGQVPSPTVGQTLNTLQTTFPGVQVHESGGRIRAVYGVPMTAGATPKKAAQAWLSQYGGVFGQASPELAEYSIVRSKSDRTLLTYTQRVDGVPVEGSMVTVVVSQLPGPKVVYASGLVALRPAGGLSAGLISSNQAQMIAQAHPAAAGLNSWSAPEVVAIYDDLPAGNAMARRVVKCVGSNQAALESFTFYVDASTGSVVGFHSNVMHFDVSGTVRGYRSLGGPMEDQPHTFGDAMWPGTLSCPNPPQLTSLPWVMVEGKDLDTGQEWTTFTVCDGDVLLPDHGRSSGSNHGEAP